MKHDAPEPIQDSASARRTALTSPFRLELLGLFGEEGELSVSEMASLVGRPATSLYHHVEILANAGILHAVRTRPKGKRFETVYTVVDHVQPLEVDLEDTSARSQVTRAITAVFRNAERDFLAALDREDLQNESEERNIFSMQIHGRSSPAFLAGLNERIRAIEEFMAQSAATPDEPGPDDQFLSMTIALSPVRGRRTNANPTKGDPS